jgi:hypothetical protein
MNNNHFKIGDSVYCHTDLFIFNATVPIYKKGEVYKILDIEVYSYEHVGFNIQSKCNIMMFFWSSIDNNNGLFKLVKRTAYVFNDHFMSLKEHRMLKLDSLNNV